MEKVNISHSKTFPIGLKYNDTKSYLLTLVFVTLGILVPWGFHQFHLAGATFLPMHIFILIAGLLFGWRSGLIVGLLIPLVSNLISGMPIPEILPQIVVELSIYGLIAGLLREKLKLGIIWSLLGAMVAGRLALFSYMLVAFLLTGEVYSPLGLETEPINSIWASIKQGWPGITIQIASIPSIIWIVTRFANTGKGNKIHASRII